MLARNYLCGKRRVPVDYFSYTLIILKFGKLCCQYFTEIIYTTISRFCKVYHIDVVFYHSMPDLKIPSPMISLLPWTQIGTHSCIHYCQKCLVNFCVLQQFLGLQLSTSCSYWLVQTEHHLLILREYHPCIVC